MMSTLTPLLVESSLKAALLIVIAFALIRVCAAAATRHQAMATALVAVLMLPLGAWLLPAWAPAGLPRLEIGGADAIVSEPAWSMAAETASDAGSSEPGATLETVRFDPWPGRGWIVARLWLVGVLASVGWLAAGSIHRFRLVRETRKITSGLLHGRVQAARAHLRIDRPVRLLITRRRTLPVTWGVVRPTVLLPTNAYCWNLRVVDDVLLHELVHVARLDALTRSLAQACCTVFWFHPLVWLAARRLRREQELACDDAVLAAGANPHDYARTLVDIARDFRAEPPAIAASLAFARPSRITRRVESILDPQQERKSMPTARKILLATGFVAVALSLAGLSPSRAEQQATTRPSASIGETPQHIYLSFQTGDLDVVVERTGKLLLGEDPADLTLSAGGHLLIRAWRMADDGTGRSEQGDYRFEITVDDSGTAATSWIVDGRPTEFDAEARAWLRPIIEQVGERERHRDERERIVATREQHRDVRDRERVELRREGRERERVERGREVEETAGIGTAAIAPGIIVAPGVAPPVGISVAPRVAVAPVVAVASVVPAAGVVAPNVAMSGAALAPEVAVAGVRVAPWPAATAPAPLAPPQLAAVVTISPLPRADAPAAFAAVPSVGVPAPFPPAEPSPPHVPGRGWAWRGWTETDGTTYEIQMRGQVALGPTLAETTLGTDAEVRITRTSASGDAWRLAILGQGDAREIDWRVNGSTQPLDAMAVEHIDELLRRIVRGIAVH